MNSFITQGSTLHIFGRNGANCWGPKTMDTLEEGAALLKLSTAFTARGNHGASETLAAHDADHNVELSSLHQLTKVAPLLARTS